MLPLVEYESHQEKLASILDGRASFSSDVDATAREIVEEVQVRGDHALIEFTERYDGVRIEEFRVGQARLDEAREALDDEFVEIIEQAAANIRRFHERQRTNSWFADDENGVILGQRVLPIERVGLYVPGGSAAYPSSLLMSAIPAQVAEVPELVLVSPPGSDSLPNETVLGVADLLGIDEVYSVGGAQAVAALAFGTDSIPRVDKIVGPGNAYVAAAKRRVFGHVDIDLVAGPSEVVVLADGQADPEFVAADLLAQAEHDERATAILVTPDRDLAVEVRQHAQERVPNLERRQILEKSLSRYGACVVTESLDQAIDIVNDLAPEHLELMVEDPWNLLTKIRHAGAIFLGPYSPEAVGDYFAGPNHVLPTGGTARYASALGVNDFVREQSLISYTADSLYEEADQIQAFANREELTAHAQAVKVRVDRRSDTEDS